MLTNYEINGTLASLRIVIPEFANRVSEYIADDFGYGTFEYFAKYVKELIDRI